MSDKKYISEDNSFDFKGEITPTDVFGFEYKNVFSPSESIDDMPKRMEQRIRQVRKLRKKNVFPHSYVAPKDTND